MLGLEIERRENVPVGRYRHDIDAANATALREALIAEVGKAPDILLLDLSPTRYLDSAGIDMLFRLNERLRQRRASLLLVIPPGSQLARLAEIVALPSVIPVYDTVEEALAARAREHAPGGCRSSLGAPGRGA